MSSYTEALAEIRGSAVLYSNGGECDVDALYRFVGCNFIPEDLGVLLMLEQFERLRQPGFSDVASVKRNLHNLVSAFEV